MKYYITDYVSDKNKEDLKKIALYCYDLRTSDLGGNIANIEPRVRVNNCGSIITDKPLYFDNKNYIDYEDFISKNILCEKIEELIVSKIFLTDIRLDTELYIQKEFDFLFMDENNYNEISKLSPQEKEKYILDYHKKSDRYDLMKVEDYTYKLYLYDYSRTLENYKNKNNTRNQKNKKDMER